VDAPPAVADPEVVDGPDIRTVQLEHQEHLGCPAPDASHLHQTLDDLVVAERVEVVHRHGSVDELGGEVDDRRQLVGGESRGPERLGLGGKNALRRDLATEHRDHAAMDAARGRPGQLLEHDRAEQRLERRARLGTEFHAPGGLDDAPECRVDTDDMGCCTVHARHDRRSSATVAKPSMTRAPGSRKRASGASRTFIERLPPPITTVGCCMTWASI
jgi:hypothetical protein